MEIVTGYTGTNHINAETLRFLARGWFGCESRVLTHGGLMAAEIDEANSKVTIATGAVCFDGVALENTAAEEISYVKAGSGKYRKHRIYLKGVRTAITDSETLLPTGEYQYSFQFYADYAQKNSESEAAAAVDDKVKTFDAADTAYMLLWSFVTSSSGVTEGSLKRETAVTPALSGIPAYYREYCQMKTGRIAAEFDRTKNILGGMKTALNDMRALYQTETDYWFDTAKSLLTLYEKIKVAAGTVAIETPIGKVRFTLYDGHPCIEICHGSDTLRLSYDSAKAWPYIYQRLQAEYNGQTVDVLDARS